MLVVSWSAHKGRLIAVALVISVLVNLLFGSWNFHQHSVYADQIGHLMATNDSITRVNATITEQIKADSIIIAAYSLRRDELSADLDSAMYGNINRDSLRNVLLQNLLQ